MQQLYPLRFQPILKQALWGGRRLKTLLGKPIGHGDDYAESWELVDHGDAQSVVEFGPLAGTTLHELVRTRGPELLGRHHPLDRFPLLLKFLDAQKTLSVQVHPNDQQAARQSPPDAGKTEAWLVLATEPGSLIYAGLHAHVHRDTLRQSLEQGNCESLLHRFEPSVGDCIFIPAGTVHALGAGIVVAEIQQSSDTTFRLFDWNRVGPDGRPRPLHIDRALEVIDFERGPVTARQPQPTGLPGRESLVSCPHFRLDRVRLSESLPLGGEDRCHIVSVLAGTIRMEGDSSPDALSKGSTVLLPATARAVTATPAEEAILLDAYLP